MKKKYLIGYSLKGGYSFKSVIIESVPITEEVFRSPEFREAVAAASRGNGADQIECVVSFSEFAQAA